MSDPHAVMATLASLTDAARKATHQLSKYLGGDFREMLALGCEVQSIVDVLAELQDLGLPAENPEAFSALRHSDSFLAILTRGVLLFSKLETLLPYLDPPIRGLSVEIVKVKKPLLNFRQYQAFRQALRELKEFNSSITAVTRFLQFKTASPLGEMSVANLLQESPQLPTLTPLEWILQAILNARPDSLAVVIENLSNPSALRANNEAALKSAKKRPFSEILVESEDEDQKPQIKKDLIASPVYRLVVDSLLDGLGVSSTRDSEGQADGGSNLSHFSLGENLDVSAVPLHFPAISDAPPGGSDGGLESPGGVQGKSFTVPDSGYGTASKTGCQTCYPPLQEQLEDADYGDVASVITDNLSLDLSRDTGDAYVDAFVDRILEATSQLSADEMLQSQLILRLPDLLRSFALRVAFAERMTDGRAVGVFTRQNRDRITEALQQVLQSKQLDGGDQDDESIAPGTQNSTADPEMTFDEKVRWWSPHDSADDDGANAWDEGGDEEGRGDLEIADESGEEGGGGPAMAHDDGEEHEVSAENNLSKVDMERINFVVNTSSFSWLLKAVQSRSQLSYHDAGVADSIRKSASSRLNQYRGNRALRSQNAVIRMAWDPRVFIEEQGYEGPQSLLTAVTISGSETKAQLLSCDGYMAQTWPLTGKAVLEALVEAAAAEPGTPVTKSLFDGLQLTLQLEGGGVRAECVGLFDSIVEVAEALAWAGAALRESSVPGKIMHSIANLRVDEKAPQLDSSVQFLLRFTEEELSTTERPDTGINGGCWLHGFLNNPVITKGFPIPLRPNDVSGLEIPLPAMALLVDAPQLTVFNNRALMKGFNAAVVPTAYADHLIKWHFIVNEDGSRLRYGDEQMLKSPQVAPSQATARIQKARHILGWATRAAYNIGSPQANYDIGWSSPDFVGPGCALEKFIISGGPGFISGGAEFSLGRKDKAPTIKRHTSYFESLSSLSSSYVVLYDTQDHRAWLSNGLHTLLHLVRASLREDQKGDFGDECLLNQTELEEDVDVASPKAAIKFLKSRRTLEQPVFPALDEVRTEQATVHGGPTTTTHYRETTTVRLKNRVCQIMEVLWQLLDHQATLDIFAAGLPVRLPRGKLEGYRFMEVATRRSITPRVVHLRAFEGAGKSWVDFVRALRAVTLFGEGFGNLIAPRPEAAATATANQTSTGLCNRWKTVPKDRDYLAAGTYDLARIMRQEGSAACNPVKLAPGIFWTQSAAAFERCACESSRGSNSNNTSSSSKDALMRQASALIPRRLCDRVQVLLPSQLSSVPRTGETASSLGLLDTDGALIFGRSELFPWRWPDLGEPKMEKPGEVLGTGGGSSDPSLLSAESASASASTTGAGTTSGESRGGTTLTAVSSPPSSQGEIGALSKEGEDAGQARSGRGIRKLWKSLVLGKGRREPPA